MGIISWIKSRSLPLYRSHTPSGAGRPRSLMADAGRDSPRNAAIKAAAAADVERLEAEDERYFSRDAPAKSEDDL